MCRESFSEQNEEVKKLPSIWLTNTLCGTIICNTAFIVVKGIVQLQSEMPKNGMTEGGIFLQL
jgi:hypothetical protein